MPDDPHGEYSGRRPDHHGYNPREMPNVGSRTPIRFGTGVKQVFQRSLPEYQQIFWEPTSEHLLCVYRRPAREGYYTFIMVQGSRFAGRLCCEVGFNRSPDYPYYRLSDEPVLAVGGLRERVNVLLTGREFSSAYTSQEALLKLLHEEVVQQAGRGLYSMNERALPVLNREHATWGPLFEQWIKAEREAAGPVGERYPELEDEEANYDRLQDILLGGKLDRVIGTPLKVKFRDPRFYGCVLYLMARGLGFLETPEGAADQALPEDEEESADKKQRMITWRDILGPSPQEIMAQQEAARSVKKVPEALTDGIAGITGRQPQRMALELSADPEARRVEFAFLKALAATEAYYTGKEM